MDSLIFELQIVFYFQLFLSANTRHSGLPTADYGLGKKNGLGIKRGLRTEYKTRTRYKMRTTD